jgi:hypothetical protein
VKERAEVAEKNVVEEKEQNRNFCEKVQGGVGELIKRTRGVGNSKEEVLGEWVSEGPEGSQLDGDSKYEVCLQFP